MEEEIARLEEIREREKRREKAEEGGCPPRGLVRAELTLPHESLAVPASRVFTFCTLSCASMK